MQINLLNLYIIFCKIGMQLLGGGYVILPLLKHEFINKYKIVTEEELLDFFAISQCIPGLIALNISIFIGNKIKGKSGSIIAVLGIITPPFFIILLLAHILLIHINNGFLQNIFWGIKAAVLSLIFANVIELWQSGIKNRFSVLLFVIILSLMLFTKISPALLVIISALTGICYIKINKKIQEEKQ